MWCLKKKKKKREMRIPMGVLISHKFRQYVASLQACCFGYEKGSYKQHRIRMNSVLGCLGTDFIRIPQVPSKKYI